jgi:2-polyprenyl-3-methyl-5-hydroxy-6-metoxy-1,4-benzoquinol methylase
MKYFEMHENVYRRLRAQGARGWDGQKSFEEMWAHQTNLYLEKLLQRSGVEFKGLKVLDLGTGSGTSALFCALKGASVVGVDASQTAIEMAKRNAVELGLAVDFRVGDFMELDLAAKFDLVIDSTLLHCLVGSDRARFYETAKHHLQRDGRVFINTMTASGDLSTRFPEEYFRFQDDVLWSLGMPEIHQREEIEGKSYFPHRTLLSDARLREEFAAHGFAVVDAKEVHNEDQSFDLTALLTLLS